MTGLFKSYTFYTVGTFFYRGILSGMFKGALGGILYFALIYQFQVIFYPLYFLYLSVPIAIYAGIFGGLLGGTLGVVLGIITLFTQSRNYYRHVLIVSAALPTSVVCYIWVFSVHAHYSVTGDFHSALPYIGATIGLFAAAHSAYRLAELHLHPKKKKQGEVIHG